MGIPLHATQLTLSTEERAAYRRLADALLQTALKEYATFSVHNPARRVSSLDWKLVKSQDGISVYKERHPPTMRRAKDTLPFVPRLLTSDGRFERVDASISVPQMLVTGTMRGTVEDAIHGAFVDGPETHATRGFYIHDRSSDFRVLTRLDEPSESDPHRFCGLAWTEMGGAGVPFVKRRDLLTLVASGMAVLPGTGGERVGYYLIHSISHPQLPALSEHKLLRAKCSFSYLFSQQHQHGVAGGVGSQVETYQKGFFAPLGDVPERGVVSAVVRTLIYPSRLVDAGYNRKLCFMLKHAPPGRAARTKSRSGSQDSHSFSHNGDDSDDDDNDSGCAGGCARRRSDSFFSSSGSASFSSSGGPLRKLTQSSQPSHGVCVICKLRVCASCKVVKKIVVDATGYELEIKSLGFCLVCVNKAKMLSAPMLARQELLEKKAASSGASVSSFTTPSSPATDIYVRVSHSASHHARSPQYDQPRLQRKTSWVGSDVSSASGKSSPSVGDAASMTNVRKTPLEKASLYRKTSWVGGSDAVASKSSFSSDEATPTSTTRARSHLQQQQSATERPQLQRNTSWSGPTGVSSGLSSYASGVGSATKARPPPPPPPSRRLQSAPTAVAVAPTLEQKPTRRAPPPEKPLFPVRAPSATTGVPAAPPRTERNGASPTGGIYLLPTQDHHAPAGTQPRRRIDERVAIEDIALRGILL